MSPQPRHGTPYGEATPAIRALARRTGADVQELQTLYVLEALLTRIAVSPYRDDFVLKGGVLLAAFGLRRPTKDIDLPASQLRNDEEGVLAYPGDRSHRSAGWCGVRPWDGRYVGDPGRGRVRRSPCEAGRCPGPCSGVDWKST